MHGKRKLPHQWSERSASDHVRHDLNLRQVWELERTAGASHLQVTIDRSNPKARRGRKSRESFCHHLHLLSIKMFSIFPSPHRRPRKWIVLDLLANLRAYFPAGPTVVLYSGSKSPSEISKPTMASPGSITASVNSPTLQRPSCKVNEPE